MTKLRVGIVGKRGAAAIAGFRAVPGVEVVAMCDAHLPTADVEAQTHGVPKTFTEMAAMLPHVDAVVIGTPMHLHVPQALEALEARKHVLSEVTAAVSFEECDALLAAVRRSGQRYMMSENYCYFPENVAVREMVRKGLFGEPYFGEGEYIHDVRFLHLHADGTPTWRAKWQVGINGNTYCTHELGPVMQWFQAYDPEDRPASVTCLGTGVRTDPRHPHEDSTITLVKTTKGRLIKLRLDMMSNTPGMTFYSLQGIHGTFESGRGGSVASRIWLGENKSVSWNDEPRKWEPFAPYLDRHLPADYAKYRAEAGGSGHMGGDFHCARIFAESILADREPDIDVVTSLQWTAVGLASQQSIALGGAPVQVPQYG